MDSILLSRHEAEVEGRQEEVDMLTDVHIVSIMNDVFFGKKNRSTEGC